jgi:hypothetical protein
MQRSKRKTPTLPKQQSPSSSQLKEFGFLNHCMEESDLLPTLL